MFARTSNSYLSWYEWSGGTWTRVTRTNALGEFDIDGFSDPACAQPACYLDLQTADVGAIDPGGPDDTEEILGRLGFGVSLWTIGAFNTWGPDYGGLDGSQLGAFADVPGPLVYTGLPDRPGDCPFSARGASGAGSGDCLGSSPSYYETLHAADIDGKPGDELLARASDGLRVKTWDPGNQPPPCCEIQPHLDALPTLTALGGAASSVQPGAWGSIRTGDINGDQRDEVLALDANGLEAYNYAPSSQTWTQLPGTLGLTGDWLTDPASYATIQVGDVDGDGKDDVVARGPYGIRTWFYDRRGTGGWERFLPAGYPAFQGGHSGASGYQNAFGAFNTVAAFDGDLTRSQSSVRDVWTQANASSAKDLTNLANELTDLQNGILRFAGCVEPPNPGSPLSYQSCARPSNTVLSQAGVPTDSTGVPISNFDAIDWTWVVNEVLTEIAMAQAVVEHFTDVETMREGVFESETNALPAIASDLQLSAAAANNPANFSLQNMFAGSSGIAASLAGLIPGEGAVASAGMWVASELASMLPSASQTATSSFQTTYGGLLTKLATAQDEMSTALSSQLQQVFADQGLRDLVGQLRSRGTWIPDTDGMQSASRQAFSLETYQALLPTMYSRWVVTGCTTNDNIGLVCKDLPSGSDVVGNTGTSAIWLGPTTSGTCTGGYDVISCDYGQNPGQDPRQHREHRLGAGLGYVQLPATEQEHPVDVRMFAGRPDRHEHRRRLTAGLDLRRRDRQPRRGQRQRGRPRDTGRGPGACRARPCERAGCAGRLGVHGQRVTGSVHCASRVGCPSRVDCACGERASSSRGPCSSTVAVKSSPAPAPGAGCGRSRSSTCAAGCSRRGAAARSARACSCGASTPARPRGSTCASPGSASATSAPCARSFRPASAAPAGRSSSRRACGCATAGRRAPSSCASAGAACATARASSPGSVPSKPRLRLPAGAWPCACTRRGWWRRAAQRCW